MKMCIIKGGFWVMNNCGGRGMMLQIALKRRWDLTRREGVKMEEERARNRENRKWDRKNKKDKEEEGDFPHFQSGGNGTQSACRLERNQLHLLLLSRSSLSLSLSRTNRKTPRELYMCLRVGQKQYTLYRYFCPLWEESKHTFYVTASDLCSCF